MPGPLQGVKVVELAGIGPGPFAGMVLADLGADVVRVERPGPADPGAPATDVLARGRRSIAVDLAHREGQEVVLRLVESADALIEGFRPGVTERLGVGPEPCLARNPRLVYGRMTGWGQDGPLAGVAGHDIDYLSLSGTLSLLGRRGEPPVPPVNLVADFGGGGMLLAVGVLAALLEVSRSGRGQVVDAAMVDGAALLSAMIWGLRAAGAWGQRGTNLLDTGAWYYEVYETADGRFVALGSLEPKFYAEMLERTGLAADVDGAGPVPDPADPGTWAGMKQRMAALVATRTRDEWCALLEGTDACFAPVLDLDEAPRHPHNAARGTFVEVAGVPQPAPAPRFAATPTATPRPPARRGEHTDEILSWLGFDGEEIRALRAAGTVA